MLEFLVRRLLPRVLTVARAVLPRMHHVYVLGYPPTEGNAVEMVRALMRRYDGTVHWVQAPDEEYLDRIGIRPRHRLRRVSKWSPLSLLRYATAELVLFTHGGYGEPAARPTKPTVNLWHGAGMKWAGPLFPLRRLRSKPCDLILAPSRLWGGRIAEFCGLSEDETLLAGYPRNDQLFRPTDPDQLSALGIDRDFVVWLPSYRNSRSGGTMAAMSDGIDAAGDAALTERFAEVVEILDRHDLQVVVKPHPLDAVARAVPGAIVVDDDTLAARAVPLYGLLGAARGLVSDTSSVWTDFLLLDRPIGFFFPDRQEYAQGRGVYPTDVLDWLPGPFLDDAEQVEEFARSIRAESPEQRERRQSVVRRSGLVQTRSAADDVLTQLRERYPHLAVRIASHPAVHDG